MFKIGEFSKLTKVSVRMLRYYDEMGLLKPAAVDKYTGYRMYDTDQIPTLQRIVLLRDMDFNVGEIAAALREWDTAAITGLLESKKAQLQEAVSLELQRIKKIEAAVKDINSNKIEVHYNVTLRQVPSFQILSVREIIPDYFCESILWGKLYDFVIREKVQLSPGCGNLAIFHDEWTPERGVDVEVGVFVSKMGPNKGNFVYRRTEPVENMACIMVYGPYENIGPAYHSFAYWLEEHRQYEMEDAPSRQICHIGQGNGENPENYLTEVQVPVKIREIDSHMV